MDARVSRGRDAPLQLAEVPLNVRLATYEDEPAVLQLTHQLATPSGMASDQTQPGFKMVFAAPEHRIWVAEADGTVVGWLHAFLALRVGVAPFIEIGGLVVHDRYRRHGAGRLLVQASINWAASQGLQVRVRSDTRRQTAHRFYQALGFTPLKQQQVYEYPTAP